VFARHLRLRIGVLAFPVCLLAAATAFLTLAGAKAAPSTWEVNTDASRVFVKVGLATRLGHEHGVQGNLKSGKLTLGGEGELVFDMASFTADTAEARKRVGLESKPVSETEAQKVTETVRGPQVLNVNQYPTATYRISSTTPLDKQAAGEPGDYQLEGRFTLHGTEQKVPVKAKVERGDKGGLKMTGTFTIKQTDYGMKPVSAAGGLAKSADELEISADLAFRPAPEGVPFRGRRQAWRPALVPSARRAVPRTGVVVSPCPDYTWQGSNLQPSVP
jgi:polyisoprenoid-binding protein YceI